MKIIHEIYNNNLFSESSKLIDVYEWTDEQWLKKGNEEGYYFLNESEIESEIGNNIVEVFRR